MVFYLQEALSHHPVLQKKRMIVLKKKNNEIENLVGFFFTVSESGVGQEEAGHMIPMTSHSALHQYFTTSLWLALLLCAACCLVI